MVIAVTAAAGVAAVVWRRRREPHFASQAAFFAWKMQGFEAEPMQHCDVIFAGDSLTAWGPFETAVHAPCVKDRGIPGDRTHWLLGRLKEITDRTPRQLFLMIGINDLAAGERVDQVVADYQAVVDYVHRETPSTRVYVESVLPTNNAALHVDDLNAQLRGLATEEKAVYVDVGERFGRNGAPRQELLRPDGLHLTARGYDVWLAAIAPLVAQ